MDSMIKPGIDGKSMIDRINDLITFTEKLMREKKEAYSQLIVMANMLARIRRAYPHVFSECIDQKEIDDLIKWSSK